MAAVKPEKAEGTKGEAKEKEFDAMAEFAKLTSSLSGCVYMPPVLLRALKAATGHHRSSAEYQRLSWDALRKSITGILTQQGQHGQHQHVVSELFSEDLIRGRGLSTRRIMKA
jgi:pre-mRNA-splicing factor CWC22